MAKGSRKNLGRTKSASDSNHSRWSLTRVSKVLSSLTDAEAIEEFLRVLLTPQELHQIPQRLAILELLSKGETQRDISATLGVGIATVTRGAREMKGKDLSRYLRGTE